ncbi:MAG TPA: alpha/beta hydrolase domain-containing protein [Steroidobacteraceae bacterium]|nr:alpha/beta hydrolase domain-containing protein [Steroidobacteraceae bacterium]
MPNSNNKWLSPLAAAIGLMGIAAVSGVSVPVNAVASAAQQDVPVSVPSVRAAPAGQHGFPFMSSVLNLAASGYVEQEFLISGTATAYLPVRPFQANGRWDVQPNPGVTAPYTTRILVRRPVNPQRFNGTVLVEWLNESGGFDTASDWLYTHEELIREGYAYVGVSAQFVGVQALLAWESGPGARYASLFLPGDSFSYDIFAQAGRSLTRSRGGDPRPLGSLTDRARTLLATGFSQSAVLLMTFANAVQPLAPVYDGFLIHDGGFGAPISIDAGSFNGDPIPGNVPATPFVDVPYPAQLRTDLKVPTLILESEFGVSDDGVGAARSFHLQRDSAHLRIWEMAGATHIEAGWVQEFTADVDKSIPGFPLQTCDGPPGEPSIVVGRAERAALNALSHWAAGEPVPAPAPRMSLNVPNPADDFDQLVTFNRDPSTNLVMGGIRLPDMAVPTATLNGNRDELDPQTLGPGVACGLVGSYDPWNRDADPWDGQPGFDPSPTPEPDLQLLYQTHLNYVQRVTGATLKSVQDGYLRPADAAKVVLDAARASVP